MMYRGVAKKKALKMKEKKEGKKQKKHKNVEVEGQ